jgi:hypothetical protein
MVAVTQLLLDWNRRLIFGGLGLHKTEGERNGLGREPVSRCRTANAQADYLTELNIVNFYFANV